MRPRKTLGNPQAANAAAEVYSYAGKPAHSSKYDTVGPTSLGQAD